MPEANNQDHDRAEETVRYETRAEVAFVTLNRPRALNAINHQLMDDLDRALDRVATNTEVKAAVIRGAGGRAFSAGGDLKQLHQDNMMHDAGRHLAFNGKMRDLFLKIERTPVPVVAVIEGFALAGGLEMAMACDIILCRDDAQIGDQHANRFLIPGAGGTQRLPRRIGSQRAKEILYTGRRLNGQEAVAYGLALRSYSADDLEAGLEDLLSQLRGKSRTGLGYMKQLVQRGLELPLREALDLERLLVQEFFSIYPDATQGVTAFNTERPNKGGLTAT